MLNEMIYWRRSALKIVKSAAVEGSEFYQPAVHADADGWQGWKLIKIVCLRRG